MVPANKVEFEMSLSRAYSKTSMKTRRDSNSSVENQSALFSVVQNFLKVFNENVMRSKIPTIGCIAIWIFVCLFGNIITGIFLCKHYLNSHSMETTKDIGINIPLQNNDSQEVFDYKFTLGDLNDTGESNLNQYLMYLNKSNGEVSKASLIKYFLIYH